MYQLRILDIGSLNLCGVIVSLTSVICVTSVGIYEANANQFRMNQLLEATLDQLSTFIHWFF